MIQTELDFNYILYLVSIHFCIKNVCSVPEEKSTDEVKYQRLEKCGFVW